MVEKGEQNKRQEPKYGPMPPDISHGRTEVVNTVKRRARKVRQEGEEIQVVDTDRVVLTPDGSPEVIAGGMNDFVSIGDATKITDEEVLHGLKKIGEKVSAARRRKQKVQEQKVKKGSS
jgi:hypothetical protein